MASLLGAAVLIATGVASRSWALEKWYGWRFDHGSEEEKLAAAARLGELGSARAVSWLLEELVTTYKTGLQGGQERRFRILTGSPEKYFGKKGCRLRAILAQMGPPALRELFQGLSAEDFHRVYICRRTLDEVSPEVWARPETTRALLRLAGDPAQPPAVGETAREVLEWLARKRSSIRR